MIKTIGIVVLLLSSISIFSQQKRQFFRNEATRSQMNIWNKNYSDFSKNQQIYRQGFYNMGSELYIEIPSKGYFTIEFAGQVISNATGKFLFFDVMRGNQPLAIYKDGYLVYRTLVSILPDSRLNFTFSTNVGLYLEETIRLRNTRDGGGNANYRVVFTESEFSLFLKKLNEQAKFDDEKIAYINQQLITTNFTAGQVKRLVEILSFSRLEVAKKLYDYCIDPQNYFVVFDAFSFSDEKNALSDYITKQIH